MGARLLGGDVQLSGVEQQVESNAMGEVQGRIERTRQSVKGQGEEGGRRVEVNFMITFQKVYGVVAVPPSRNRAAGIFALPEAAL